MRAADFVERAERSEGGEDNDHNLRGLGFRVLPGPKVCKIMAVMAIIRGLGLLVYILLGF